MLRSERAERARERAASVQPVPERSRPSAAVERQRAGPDLDERQHGGDQHDVVLVAAVAQPRPVLGVHGLDRREHRRGQHRGRERRRQAGREQRAAAGLGRARGDRVGLGRAQAQLLEALGGRLQAVAAEPAEQLLRAVPEEEPTHDHPQQQPSDLHLSALSSWLHLACLHLHLQRHSSGGPLYGAAGTTTSGPCSRGQRARLERRRSTGARRARSAPGSRRPCLEEADARRAVVHRHDPARRQALDDRRGLLGADRGTAADGDEQQVDRADRRRLLVAQRALAEVAEVAHAQPVELEHEDRVRPARGARLLVVLGGDRRDLAERRLERARRRAQDRRIAADRLDAVVVDVLVGDQQQLGLARPRSAGSRTASRGRSPSPTCPRTGRSPPSASAPLR